MRSVGAAEAVSVVDGGATARVSWPVTAAVPVTLIGSGFGEQVKPAGNPVAGQVTLTLPVKPPVGVTDRKSTRLNSSHSQISYAVFCLKKKKRTYVSHILTSTNEQDVRVHTASVLVCLRQSLTRHVYLHHTTPSH